ncbi:acyl-CoA dehydrogenase [Pseudomonas sp. BN505]|uniref:acyl-CoA dehydrogenase family protein n=1 Tax=unclassified Pseudomonas TaxID=196821 RepID=UPI002455068B|nr:MULTISPECIES: acyl-CoA dehydrogenase family protein [unclassified Pseudomonas]MDH4842289.1 acyl-CoA dehydrogenase [Pseudomonas sp. BN605]MDH4855144.1 acyl-CoA dehydrogenase [Pseudomonas sp. BN505]
MRRIGFSTEHHIFRDAYRTFLQKEVQPKKQAWRDAGIVPREMFKKMGELGFLLVWAKEEHGGLGLWDFRYQQIMIEEDNRFGEVGFYHTLHSRLVAPYIQHFGDAGQQERFLPRCAAGDTILAIAMTEPDAGSDLAGMKTRAQEQADHWVINGAKTYISNGINSDVVVVAAKTNPENPRQIGLFLVERGMPGFERGRRLEKMGVHAQDTAELFFNNVRVPKENVLGNSALGLQYLKNSLVEERLISAVGSLANAQCGFDLTRNYVSERKAFGKKIADFQNTRFTLAEMAADLEVAQVYVDRCVELHNEGELSVQSAAKAKLITSELESRVMDSGVQLHGGAGYMKEYEICQRFLDARVSRIFAGSSEIMKEIIARSILG